MQTNSLYTSRRGAKTRRTGRTLKVQRFLCGFAALRGKPGNNFLFIVLAAILLAACTGRGSNEAASINEEIPAYLISHWPALALLKTGENPLWFELGADGPTLIESPADASLKSFSPWPHARHIIGMKLWDGFLVMAVNRSGFLVLGPTAETTDIILYRVADSGLWDSYTAESFFLWEERPAVLLYRNDFFSAPVAGPLDLQVFVLDKTQSSPAAAKVPALMSFPQEGLWEAEIVHQGPGGYWYYRMRKKDPANRSARTETVYFRTTDLTKAGERISTAEWRNSFLGLAPNAPDQYFSLLPQLPEGFVYTGAVFLGNVLVASWEEQEDAGIGAAGFAVMAR